ncbi:hypothetical protein D3C81_1662830 [compost metagenome]
MHAVFDLAHRAFDFRMAIVADHDDLATIATHFFDFDMDLGHQRTSRIKDTQAALLGFRLHRLGHAMRGKYDCIAGRHIIELFNKDRTLVAQVRHHIGVMHDLVAHIDRRAELGQRTLDDFNRTIHTGTKTARLGK